MMERRPKRLFAEVGHDRIQTLRALNMARFMMARVI
jgi:hypothetical protein